MSNSDYKDLTELRSSRGYVKLMGIWGFLGQKILEETRKAAKKANEGAWRYYAGKQEGFEEALQALDKALAQLEQHAENQKAQVDIDAALKDIKTRGGVS